MRPSPALLAAFACGLMAPVVPPPVGRHSYAPRRQRTTRCGCPQCSSHERERRLESANDSGLDTFARASNKRARKRLARLDLVARGVLLPAKGGV